MVISRRRSLPVPPLLLVEEKTGKLIGLAVAKLGSVDTIGLVIPADELRPLASRTGRRALDLTLKTLDKQNANLEIKAQIVDPKGNVKDVLVHAAPASVGTVSPNTDGVLSAVAEYDGSWAAA